MIFFHGLPMLKTDFVSPDGTKIHVSFSVAECDPPIYTYRMKIGDGPFKEVSWKEIYPIMHDQYGIPTDEIPDKYKPEYLKKKEPVTNITEPVKPRKYYAATYISPEGTVVKIGYSTAESDPPQHYFYYEVYGKTYAIEQRDIFNLLTEVYGIDPSLVDHYKIPLD
jgi:hypothetical protein